MNTEAISGAEAEVTPEVVPATGEPVEAIDPAGAPTLEEQLAEAEQRGYLRGRNEAIAEHLNSPDLWGAVAAAPSVPFLENPPRSAWDDF